MKERGYAAILAVIILGAACISMVFTLAVMGADATHSVEISQFGAQARGMADACAEEALQKIHDDITFNGTNVNLTIGSNSCTYTVTGSGGVGTTRTLTTNSTISNVTRKTSITVTINAASISITSWQEIP